MSELASTWSISMSGGNHRSARCVGYQPAAATSAAFTNPDAAAPPSVLATLQPPTHTEHEAFKADAGRSTTAPTIPTPGGRSGCRTDVG